jgi:small subunit ribosomal protein S33
MATRRLIEHSKEKIQRVAARIFQSAYNETNVPTGRKLLKKAFYGPKLLDWYPEKIEKLDMLFEDPDDKRRKVKLERMKRRGKGPPKKGEGKRSKKK